MKTVFAYARPYIGVIIVALSLMLVELFVELVQPLIMSKIIDDGIISSNTNVIIYYGLIMIGLTIVALAAGIINSYFSSHAAQSFAFDLRNALFSKIQSFTMATYLKFPTSGLITRLTSDITQVQNVLFMSLRIMLRAPLQVVGSIALALYVNAKIAMFFLIGVPILLIFLAFMVSNGIRLFSLVQKRLDRVNRVLQEGLQAIRLVKAYMRGKYEASRFEQVSTILKLDTMKALRTMELILPILMLVMNFCLLAVIWFGSKQIASGGAEVGELVAIVNYATRMTGAFSMFAFIIIAFARAKASAQRMEEVLLVDEGTETYDEASNNTSLNNHNVGAVEFNKVSFTYPNTKERVLNHVSFTVNPGEKLAIMGATGSGKSTLLNLLPRLYEASSGEIFVNGRNVLDWNLEELREIIGFVPQQSMLFTGSIYENVSWGKSDATLDEVESATKKAQIHDAVESFPDQYSTRVGQKGVNLSGGQKQRLSIARALIRKSQILILDDSTSALDVKTESALWHALEEECTTMLVVTQKIRTAKIADRILLLDEGEVVGFGTHHDLVESNELYRKIAISQQELEANENEPV